MGNNVKKRFTVSLDIETKDLEKQVKGTVGNIKTILADIGSAADKMSYFKELVDYIGEIDSALVALRTKNKSAFDHMFDGLDENLKREFEKIFGVAKDQLGVLDQLKGKLAALKSSGTTTGADLKPLEQDVKDLYESLGMLDKLDLSGKGKVETRIKKLEAALEGFATVFGDVNAKISKGFGFGSGGNGAPDLVKDVNKQVDYLKQAKKTITKAVNDFYKELTKISGSDFNVLESIKMSLQKDLRLKDEEFFNLTDIFYELEDGDIEADEAIKKIVSAVTRIQKAKQEVVKEVLSDNAIIDNGAQPSLADVIEREVHDAVNAIESGKKQLVEAWKDYYYAVKEAEDNGMDLMSGSKSSKMTKIEDKIRDMMDALGVKAAKPSAWGIQTDLDLSEYIIDGDIGLDDIEEELNKLFDKHEVSFSAIFDNIQTELNDTEDKTNAVLTAFKNLVNYVSNSGNANNPGKLFDKLEQGAHNANDELRAILESLNLIDASGNVKFHSINSGFTNQGGFVSDQYTMIARNMVNYAGTNYLAKSEKLQSKLAAAEAAGAQIGTIVELIKDEAHNLFYEIQKTVSGTAAFSNDDGSFNIEVLDATEEQLRNLAHTMKALSDNGLFIDFGGSNILYDKDKGFSIIDLGLVGGHGHTVSKQNTLQENIDRFVQECIDFAPGKAKEIQNLIADRLYAVAQNIDSSIINPNAPSKPAVQSQNANKKVVASLGKEEGAHQDNAAAIEAENAALKEQIELKQKAQSMKWKDFATDLSLTDAKHAAGLYTLGDMEHYWKQANYEKQVDFHELSQNEINSMLAKLGYKTHGDGTLDDLIKAKGAYDVAEAWYDDADFSAKTKMENMVLEDIELRNIAMNKLYELHTKYGKEVMSFTEFLDATIEVYRGDKGPTAFTPDDILAFSPIKGVARGLGNGAKAVKAYVKPKDTMGSLSTADFHDAEYEFNLSPHLFPQHELYLNDKYKSFEEYYNQQSDEIKAGIDKYLIMAEKNRIKDLIGDDVAGLISKIKTNGGSLQQFGHGIVPNSIISDGMSYYNQLEDIYNNADEMTKKLIAYYASLSQMSFGHTAYTKEVGATGFIGAVTNDPTGVKNHINGLTGEYQYNIFGQTPQHVIDEAEAHKKNTQAIQEEVKAQKQLNSEKISFNDVSAKLMTAVNHSSSASEWNDLDKLENQLSNVNFTTSWDPSKIANGEYTDPNGITHDLSEIGDLISKIEKNYGTNLDYVKQYLEQIVSKYVTSDYIKASDVLGQLDSSVQAANGTKLDKLAALYHDVKNVPYTVANASQDIVNDGWVMNGVTGELTNVTDIFGLINKIEQEYGENLDYIKEYLQGVYDDALTPTIELSDDDVIVEEQSIEDKYKQAIQELNVSYSLAFSEAEEEVLNKIKKHIEWIQDDVYTLEPILSDGKYFNNTFGVEDYISLEDVIGAYEYKYGPYLEKVREYLKSVFAEYIEKMTNSAMAYEPIDALDDGGGKSTSELYNDAMDEITNLYMSAANQTAENAIYEIKKHIGWIQADVDSNEPKLSEGKYLNSDYLDVDYTTIFNMVAEFENKYNANLANVCEYLHSVFASYMKTIDNLDEIDATSFVDVVDNSGIDEYATKLNDAKYKLEVELEKLYAANELDLRQLHSLSNLLKNIDYVDIDVQAEAEQIQNGLYEDWKGKQFSYADLSDMISDYEGKYGADLSEAHEYLKHVFKKQYDEIDALFSGELTTLASNAPLDNEKADLSDLTSEVGTVEQAVKDKTAAFEEEAVTVGVVVDQEIASLNNLKDALSDIQDYLQAIFGNNTYNLGNLDLSQDKINDSVADTALQTIQQTLGQILTVLQGFTGIKSDHENSLTYQEPVVDNGAAASDAYQLLSSKLPDGIATENTLNAIKGILEQLSSVITNKLGTDGNKSSDEQQNLNTLVSALTANVTILKDVASGIVQHQKTQKSDTTKAMARIQDPKQNQMISGLAKDAVKTLGTDAEIESLQALANGVVKIEGAFKNANGVWEGFSVKINEYNQAVDLAIKKQSSFAKMLNATKDVDDNPYIFNKEEVEARAKKHLEEYAAQGKNATVQFKDSGRYTITILEEIDGLTKQIFQTFDENDDKIERTTVTMSNNQKTKLEALQKKLIDTGLAKGLISDSDDVYTDYKNASDVLANMTSQYSQLDSLSDQEIANWKQQIVLVDQLGQKVADLIQDRKQSATGSGKQKTNKFTDAGDLRQKLVGKFNTLDFNLDTENLSDEQKAIADEYKELTNTLKQYKQDVSNVSQDEINATLQRVDALHKEIDAYKQKYNILNAHGKASGNTHGASQLATITAKYNALRNGADDVGLTSQSSAVMELEAAYNRLVAAQAAFVVGEDKQSATGKAKIAEFNAAKLAYNELAKSLNKIVTESKRLEEESVIDTWYDENPNDDLKARLEQRKEALREFVTSTYGAKASLGDFNGSCEKLSFTVKNGDGTITKMTATINAAKTAIYATTGATEEAVGGLKRFFNDIGSKFKSIIPYLTASMGWQEIWQQLRKGVEYVREIDSALTELKKVTNQTEAEYQQFLKTMSKTAGVVGSTVKDLTSSAAD